MFRRTHPIIGTCDIKRAIEFYTRQLGFQLAFQDNTKSPNYVGFRRDQVEFHTQFQYEHEMSTILVCKWLSLAARLENALSRCFKS